MSILSEMRSAAWRATDWSQTGMRALFKRTPADGMVLITKAVDGLLYSSESDYPLTPFTLKETGPVTPETLLKAANLPPETPVTKVDFDAFFAPMLRLREGASPEAQARVARYQKLVELLRKYLSDLAVYKLSKVEMPAYVVGRLANGSIAGLRTTVVET
jgi:nuclease A inhibitor-like protein